MARGDSVAERVAARLRELSERRGFRSALAKRLDYSPAAISPYVSGERPVTLEMLEAIAELSQIPIAELVAPPGSLVKQLNADEASILRYLRRWPSSVARSLLGFLAHFADEAPVETQARNLHEFYRRMDQTQRDELFSVAVLMREGKMTSDMLRGLRDHLEREQYGREADDAKRRRKT